MKIPAALCLALLPFFSPVAAAQDASPPPKAPYRVIYSNDTTNITSCPSPYHPNGPFSEKDLRASVDETAGTGIQAHFLQPGLGWVPWWQSKFLPMSEHVAWLEAHGRKPNTFEEYVLHGGDLVRVFVDECRKVGEAPFISLRMNDAHHIYRGSRVGDPAMREKAMEEFAFFADHPDYRLGPGVVGDDRMVYAMDWARPEVREYKYKLLEELCENYDIDGIELDFMRCWYLFNPRRTPPEERKRILAGFVARVRRLLDRTSRNGRRRWLCLRVPGYPETYDAIGIDLPAFTKAGMDMVNVSGQYFTDMQMDIGGIVRSVPAHVAVYDELQYVTAIGPRGGSDGKAFSYYRRTTEEQYDTAAHLAYAEGAGGVSAFNFQYYRGTHNPQDVAGVLAEPPFQVFWHLGDPAWLARRPQDYVIGLEWNTPIIAHRPLLSPFHPGEPQTMQLEMAPPAAGWTRDGRIRIEGRSSLGRSEWTLRFNGTALTPTADVPEPYPNPYPEALGKPEDYRAWTVPARLLRAGKNSIELSETSGETEQLFFLDLSAP